MKNPSASVRARLLNYSQKHELVFNDLLVRYALEGLLQRLSLSPHADQFILKGGMLYPLWAPDAVFTRTTRDVDLLSFGSPEPQRILEFFQTLDSSDATAEDGLVFSPSEMSAQVAREDDLCQGVRLDAKAHLGSAIIRFHADIGFGDSVYPAAETRPYPRLLELPPASLRVYPIETVIAEKFEAMVNLGHSNSRMKDFYDIDFLSNRFTIDGHDLTEAIDRTFAHRKTPIPTVAPLALTDDFAEDAGKMSQWKAFLRKNRFADRPLREIVGILSRFLTPVLARAAATKNWNPGGPWE